MKKRIFSILILCIVLSLLCVGESFAVTSEKSWTNSSYSQGYYVPVSGSMVTNADNGKIKTVVNMTLDSTNVSRIKLYNSGSTSSLVHPDCQGKKTYLTCDVTSVKKSTFEYVHATSVSSNLPNPVYDLENDNPMTSSGLGDYYNEESETVVLGTVSAKSYTMTTLWDDMRTGSSTCSGKFQCQFGMSKKGALDYNNVVIANGIQAVQLYNGTKGQL